MCPLKVCNAVPLKLSNSFISARISILTETVTYTGILKDKRPTLSLLSSYSALPSHPLPAPLFPYLSIEPFFPLKYAYLHRGMRIAYVSWQKRERWTTAKKSAGLFQCFFSLLNVEKGEWRMCLSRWLKWEWTFRPGWTWVPSSPPASTKFKSKTFIKTVLIFSIYLDIRLKRSLLFWHRL